MRYKRLSFSILSLLCLATPVVQAESNIFDEIVKDTIKAEQTNKAKDEFLTGLVEVQEAKQARQDELKQLTRDNHPTISAEVSYYGEDVEVAQVLTDWGYHPTDEAKVVVVFTDSSGTVNLDALRGLSSMSKLYILNGYGKSDVSEEFRSILGDVEGIEYRYIEFNKDDEPTKIVEIALSLNDEFIQAVEDSKYIKTTVNLPINNMPNAAAFTTYPVNPSTSFISYWYNDPEYLALIGRNHSGMDISYNGYASGDIYAVMDGVVQEVVSGCGVGDRACGGGWGNYVKIAHTNGLTTLSAHLNTVNVQVGQTVTAGQVIGTMGTTGRSDGVHLHFEVWYGGQRIDPYPYFNWSIMRQTHANPNWR